MMTAMCRTITSLSNVVVLSTSSRTLCSRRSRRPNNQASSMAAPWVTTQAAMPASLVAMPREPAPTTSAWCRKAESNAPLSALDLAYATMALCHLVAGARMKEASRCSTASLTLAAEATTRLERRSTLSCSLKATMMTKTSSDLSLNKHLSLICIAYVIVSTRIAV